MCSSDAGGMCLRIEQLVEDHRELRQGLKAVKMILRAVVLFRKIKVRNRGEAYMQ